MAFTFKLTTALLRMQSAQASGTLAAPGEAFLCESLYSWRVNGARHVSYIGAAMPESFLKWLEGKPENVARLGELERAGHVRFSDRDAARQLALLQALDVERLASVPGSIWARNTSAALSGLISISAVDMSTLQERPDYKAGRALMDHTPSAAHEWAL